MKSLAVLCVAMIPLIALAPGAESSADSEKMSPFCPAPLADAWSAWLVGEWEGTGASETGTGRGVTRYELGLGGQFLISHGEATITAMSSEQVDYLRRHMHASEEEIVRFRAQPYRAIEIFTVHERTGEVVGYSFDSLRCIATGRGRREGNCEIMEWRWTNGLTSTRITERVGDDRMTIIQRTPMADGSMLEERGESIRRHATSSGAHGGSWAPAIGEPVIVRREAFLVMGVMAHFAPGAESGEAFGSVWSRFEAVRGQVEPHSTDQRYYGVSFASEDGIGFDYLAGMAVARGQAGSEGFTLRDVPAASYAVFPCPTAAIGQTKHFIYSSWSATSGYAIDRAAPAFEQYPQASDTESPVLIHIAVQVNGSAARESPEAVSVRGFVDAINRQDLAGMASLMPEDHTFIDSEGQKTTGRAAMLAAWPRYFAMFPDYRIVVDHLLARDDVVVVLGSWSGTYAGTRESASDRAVGGPAAWSASVRAGKIQRWQVFADHTLTHQVVSGDGK